MELELLLYYPFSPAKIIMNFQPGSPGRRGNLLCWGLGDWKWPCWTHSSGAENSELKDTDLPPRSQRCSWFLFVWVIKLKVDLLLHLGRYQMLHYIIHWISLDDGARWNKVLDGWAKSLGWRWSRCPRTRTRTWYIGFEYRTSQMKIAFWNDWTASKQRAPTGHT